MLIENERKKAEDQSLLLLEEEKSRQIEMEKKRREAEEERNRIIEVEEARRKQDEIQKKKEDDNFKKRQDETLRLAKQAEQLAKETELRKERSKTLRFDYFKKEKEKLEVKSKPVLEGLKHEKEVVEKAIVAISVNRYDISDVIGEKEMPVLKSKKEGALIGIKEAVDQRKIERYENVGVMPWLSKYLQFFFVFGRGAFSDTLIPSNFSSKFPKFPQFFGRKMIFVAFPQFPPIPPNFPILYCIFFLLGDDSKVL
jgi:hypothetical protein